jgi:hypothetical protein
MGEVIIYCGITWMAGGGAHFLFLEIAGEGRASKRVECLLPTERASEGAPSEEPQSVLGAYLHTACDGVA